MKRYKKYWIYLLAIIIVAGVVGWYSHSQKVALEASINSFEDCRDAGYPIMESYPEQCRTSGGKHFTRQIEEQFVVIGGEIVCLPHKGDGPHTLECAFGLKAEDGTHYALLHPAPDFFINKNVGDRVSVSGILSSPQESSYDIVGTINIESIE